MKILIVLVSLVVLLFIVIFVGHRWLFPLPQSNQATIPRIENQRYKLGAATIEQPKNMVAYVKVLANQVKYYNQKVPDLWPDNPQVNQWVIAQDIKTNQAWLISPQGAVTELSAEQLTKYQINASFKVNGGWGQFEAQGIAGAYLALDPAALTNFYSFQRYEHVGTYDPVITYIHELFHAIPQEKWAQSTFSTNRDERMEDEGARRKRMLLWNQLTAAISQPAKRDELTKAAVATYLDYQKEYPEDAKAALLWDRLEGTAFYYELVGCLYGAYPEQIKNQDDLYGALELLLANQNPAYRDTGNVVEGYSIGGFAGILLDLLARENQEDLNQWKKTIMSDGDTTPMTILAGKYAENDLPKPASLPNEAAYQKWLKEKEEITPLVNPVQGIFDLLYHLLFGFLD